MVNPKSLRLVLFLLQSARQEEFAKSWDPRKLFSVANTNFANGSRVLTSLVRRLAGRIISIESAT